MSQLFNAEMILRYSNGDKTVEISWDPEVSYEDAFMLAHSNEDGSPPNPPLDVDDKKARLLWVYAMKLRVAEEKFLWARAMKEKHV